MRHLGHPPHARQLGRTILELMISITIGLVILLALGTVYLGTTSTSRQSSAVSRMSEDAAIAFNLLGGALRMAGYSPPQRSGSPGCTIENGKRNCTAFSNFTGAGLRACDHGFTDEKAAFHSLSCQSADASKPAAFAIRFEGDTFNTVPIDPDNSGTFLPSDCLNQAIRYKVVSSLAGFEPYDQVEARYFIKTGSGGVPELYCVGNGGTGYDARYDPSNTPALLVNPQPLIQYVEDIQLRYRVIGTNPASPGQPLSYDTTAAKVDELSGSVDERWGQVAGVSVCLVLRSQERDQAGAGSYIGCDGHSAASADGFARRSFTTFYALRNRVGS